MSRHSMVAALAAALLLSAAASSRAAILVPGSNFPDSPAVGGAEWNYLSPSSDPAGSIANFHDTWFLESFNDSSWNSGPAGLGYNANNLGDPRYITLIDVPSSGSRRTAYFRHQFDAGPDGFPGLAINLRRDDGAIVYLNGVEIARSNISLTAPNSYTLMAPNAGDNGNTWFQPDLPPLTMLKPGMNTLAVSVHQASTTSSDLVFDLELEGLSRATIVNRTSEWSYLSPTSDPNAADPTFNDNWFSLDFDDSAWDSGAGVLGYPSSKVDTDIGQPPSGQRGAAYFRHWFDAGEFGFDDLEMLVQRDDGAIIYLNGVEIGRSNMPDGPDTWDLMASSVVGGADETTLFPVLLPEGLEILPGMNLLAVSVHQANFTSSDIIFSMELFGSQLPPPPIIPEPSALLLLLCGALGLALTRRRRR